MHALRAGAPAERVEIVLNGADLRRFSPEPRPGGRRDPGEVRRPHGLRMPAALSAEGYPVPDPGRRRAQAPGYPDSQLVLAGDGFERTELEDLAARARHRGRDDVPRLGAELRPPGLLPLRRRVRDPFPRGGVRDPGGRGDGLRVPVVSSDAGGLPEVVQDGVTGRVVPRGDAEALAGAIDGLLADDALRDRMGKAGRERALRLFDWDHSAGRFETLFRRLVAERGKRA